ncbi:hypothetical protein LPJ56_002309, partial [Coemansia sp. RSA 2599]
KLHRNAEPKLPSTHPLNGIDHYRYWARKLTLNPAQIESLKEFVQEEERTTPLDDHEALQRAAEAAGVSVELARRFYRNVIGKMTQVDIKRRNMTKRRLFIRERIRAAKEKAIAEGRLPASTKKSRPERQLKRRPWSESESNMVAMAYAILRNHAHSHRHPFLLFNIAKLFPNRAHVANPNEGVRGRWARLRRDQAYASMADTLYVVWKYVLRDAVESDILYDEPDLTDFDLQAAAKHYREVLNQMSLDSLVEKYADEINEDIEGGTEALISGKWRLTRVLADKRRGPRQPRTRSSRKPADGAVSGRHGPRIPFTYRYRLPKTMVGNEGRYLISLTAEPRGRGGRVHIDDNGFPEDMYMEGISTRSRRQLAYSGMLVAHDSNRDLGDHFSQVTTLLSGSGLSDADTVVAHAADSSIYPDCMSSLSPVERTIDLDDLVSKVNSLIIGEDVEEGQGDRDTEARADNSEFLDDPAEQYAHVAAMQAMLINLTLTPESEYEVASGHRLLSTDERSATAALQALSQNAVVNRLTSMATTTGVGNSQDADTSADAAAEPAQKGNGGKSTVVVHKTTGVLRVAFSDAPRIGQNSEGFSSEDAAQERSVPGRGISISEKFLLAISSTLSPGYTTKTVLDPMSVAGSSLTDERLSAGEFSHLCRLISDGALWLRQEYSADPLNRVLGAFAGFKDQEVGSMLQFKVAAIVDHNLLRSFEKNRRVDAAAGQGQLPEEMQELVRRLVVCVVDFLGPLGASVYELKQLFGQLAKSVHGIPEQLAAWMADELQIASLMRDLVSQGCLASAGSSDLRYVSTSMFKKHWVAHANDMDYLPYVGQNLGGAVNTEYTLGMLASLVGHILDSPGISQAVLMRRHYAPFVPRAEVVRYLEILVNLGIVYGQWDPESFDNEEDVQINGSSDRLLAIERLMAALRESELGTDLDNGSSKLHKRRTASSSSGSDSDDSEFEQASASDEESVGGESERIGDAADKELEKKEKKFILRFKMAESRDKGASNRQLKAGDIDWSDFDIETINEILARREELNRVKRMAMGEQAHESRTSRLKKSSLAPAPLNLRKSRPGKNARPRDDIEEGEEVEDQEMEYQDKDGVDEGEQPSSYGEEQQREQQHEPQEEEEEEDQNGFAEAEPEDSLDKMDIDTEELGELFEDIDEADVLVQGQMALHLPPRASVHTEEVGVTEQASDVGQQQRELRPHPAMARGSGLADTVQTGPPKDMRLELQNELQ